MRGTMNQMEEVSDSGYKLPSEGAHVISILEKNDKETKNGDPMISLTIEIVEGRDEGLKLYDNITLSERPDSPGWKIRWRAKQFLKAIGEPHNGDSFGWDSDRWVGKRCIASVVHEIQQQGKYAGQKQARVKAYLPLDASKLPADPSKGVFEEDPEIPF